MSTVNGFDMVDLLDRLFQRVRERGGFRCKCCDRWCSASIFRWWISTTAKPQQGIHHVVAATAHGSVHRWCYRCMLKIHGIDHVLQVTHRLNPPPDDGIPF